MFLCRLYLFNNAQRTSNDKMQEPILSNLNWLLDLTNFLMPRTRIYFLFPLYKQREDLDSNHRKQKRIDVPPREGHHPRGVRARNESSCRRVIHREHSQQQDWHQNWGIQKSRDRAMIAPKVAREESFATGQAMLCSPGSHSYSETCSVAFLKVSGIPLFLHLVTSVVYNKQFGSVQARTEKTEKSQEIQVLTMSQL